MSVQTSFPSPVRRPGRRARLAGAALLVLAALIPSLRAQTAFVDTAYWSHSVDADQDGCVASARLNWDVDVNGTGTLLVYENVWGRPSGSLNWNLLYTSFNHVITGSGEETQWVTLPGNGNCNTYEYLVETFYYDPFFGVWWPGGTFLLLNHLEEQSTLDVAATVSDAWWSQLTDLDGDGCPRSARLHWNPDVLGSGSWQVYEELYNRPSGGGPWTWFATTPLHTVTGTTTNDARFFDISGNLDCDAYDWRIDIHRSGALLPDRTRGPIEDLDLFARGLESPYHDLPDDRFEPNNTTDSATPLHVDPFFGLAYEWDLSLAQGDEDWFEFTTGDWCSSYDFAAIYYNPLLGDVVFLLADEQDQPLEATLDWDWDGYAVMELNGLPPGTYRLGMKVLTGLPQPYYEIAVAAPIRSGNPDRYEPNDTLFNPTVLGTLQGLTTLPALGIHGATDSDVFLFTTTATGGSGDAVSIQFRHAEGDLGLALYNGAGVLLSWQNGIQDGESLSLQGLPQGDYHALVYGSYGAFNLDYTLSIKAPGQGAIPGDAFEANDNKTQVDARTNGIPHSPNLGPLVGTRRLDPLTLHAAGNADWFRFELTTNAGPGHFVALLHDYHLGDLDLRLCDGNGVTLPGRVANGLREVEQVDLAGLPAGTYYAVVEGWQNATNPLYSLLFHPPTQGDAFEPNPSAEMATDLGHPNGVVTLQNLSLHTEADEDWFRFELTEPATAAHAVSLLHDRSLGDLDLELCDVGSNLIRRAASGANAERIPLDGLPANTPLYLRVLGAPNPAYVLSLDLPGGEAGDHLEDNNTPETASLITDAYSGSITLGDASRPLSIHAVGDEDWFGFTLDQVGGPSHVVAIALVHTLGDLDLELYRLGDPTPVGKATGVANLHQIPLNGLPPGEYRAKVHGYQNALNPFYQLLVHAPLPAPESDALEPNDDANAPRILGVLNGPYQRPNLSIHQAGDRDWFEFTLPTPGQLGHLARITFDHALGDLDLELYDIAGTLLARSAGVTGREEISLRGLSAGTYRLLVQGYGGAVNPRYTLALFGPQNTQGDWADQPRPGFADNNTAPNAYDLRQVRGLQTWDPLSIHSASDADWFRITTVTHAAKGHFVAIQFDPVLGDLDLAIFDAAGATQLGASETSLGVEYIDLSELDNGGVQGAYLVRVSGHHGALNPFYQLKVHAPKSDYGDRFEPNNTQPLAADLKEIQGTRIHEALTIHQSGDEDWFRFTTVGTGVEGHGASILFDHHFGHLSLHLLTSDGRTLNSTDFSDRQVISLAGVPAGTHYLHVTGSAGDTQPAYSLLLTTYQEPEPDWAETNDTQGTATDLREVHASLQLGGLSIHTPADEDWFLFQLLAPGRAGQSVRIDFNRFEGDLKLELVDPLGQSHAATAGNSNTREVFLDGRPAGTFYIKVSGTAGSAHPAYTLSLQATPALQPDLAEVNDTPAQAYNLRQLANPEGRWLGGHNGSFVAGYSNGSFGNFGLVEPQIQAIFQQQGIGAAIQYETDLFSQYTTSLFDTQTLLNGQLSPNATLNSGYNAGLNSILGGPLGSLIGAGVGNGLPGLTFTAAVDPFGNQGINQVGLGPGGFALNSGLYGNLVQPSSPYQTAQLLPAYASPGPGFFQPAPTLAPQPYFPTYSLTQPQYSPSPNQAALLLLLALALTRDSSPALEPVILPGLSIHEPGDEDWFRFELPRQGEPGQFVAITFDETLGRLGLDLFEAFEPSATPPAAYATFQVQTAAASGNHQQISLAGLAPGSYLLRVAGLAQATQPDYALALNLAPASSARDDFAEPNDTAVTAHDLRTVDAFAQLSGLSIHTTNDVDWFAFTLAADGSTGHVARIDFSHAAGDLDLELYGEDGTPWLGGSYGTANTEEIRLAGLDAGTYQLRIVGYRRALNPSYTLTLITPDAAVRPDRFEPNNSLPQAINLDLLGHPSRLQGLSLHNLAAGPEDDDIDIFTFTIPTGAAGGSGHVISLDYERGRGPIDLDLYQLGGPEPFLLPGASGSNDETASLLGLGPNTYAIVVRGATTDTANHYSLHLSLPAATAATSNTAPNAWTIMVYMTASDLHQFAWQDVNEMETAATLLPGNVQIAVLWDQSALAQSYATGGGAQAAWDGVGRALIRPDTRRDVVATSFDLSPGEQDTGDPGTVTEFVAWAAAQAPAEHYALILWDHGGGVLSGFNLDNEGNRFASGANRLYHDELASALNALDTEVQARIELIAFDACLMGMAEVGHALKDHCRVLAASQETEGGNGYDYTTALAALLFDPERVTAGQLGAGIVLSYQNQYQGDRRAQDTHAALWSDGLADDALMAALRGFTDSTLAASSADWSALLAARQRASSFQQRDEYRDLGQFMAAVAASTAGSSLRNEALTVLARLQDTVAARASDQRNTSGLSIYLPAIGSPIAAGYLERNGPFLDATHWDQFLARFLGQVGGRSLSLDWSEANDVAPRAFNLHTLVGSNAFSGLSLHDASDRDWFRVTLATAPAPGSRIQALAASGLLELELHQVREDGTRVMLAGAMGTIDLNALALAPGEFLVQLRSGNNAEVPAYTLVVETPDDSAPRRHWVGANDTISKAHDLGVIVGPTLTSGLVVNPGETNWYRFATPRNQLVQNGVLFVRPTGGRTLQVTLRNAEGAPLTPPRQASGNTVLVLEYPAGAGVTYLLEVASLSAASGSYTLHFEPSQVLAPRLVGFQRQPEGQSSFVIQCLPGFTNVIQTSTNLVDWHTLETLVNTDGLLPYVDPTGADPVRFYRVLLLP